MTTLIRGYGLPNEAASSYNGYGRFGGVRYGSCCVAPNAPQSLYATLPDPELGDVRGFDGYGLVQAPQSALRADNTKQTVSERYPSSGGSGGGGVALGLGALALLFFLR